MADTSLRALTSVVYQMAEETQKEIKKDVHDIRNTVCGIKGVLEPLYTIDDNISELKKAAIPILKNTSEQKIFSNKSEKIFIQNSNSIVTILGNISNQLKRMSIRSLMDRRELGMGRNIRLNRNDSGRGSQYNFKSKKMTDLMNYIEIIERLKRINLKDFINAEIKMKGLSTVMDRAKKIFNKFKNKKEVEDIFIFVDRSAKIIKILSKIWLFSKPAQLGVKALERVFLGGNKPGGGLLAIFRKINLHKKSIATGAVTLKMMAATCKSMLIISMVLATTAVFAAPAMLGAFLMKGIVGLLIGTYKVLSKSLKSVTKGSVVLLIMSASIVTFGLGLALTIALIKNIKFKDLGILLASIAGVGVAVAGVGFLMGPILKGSITLAAMGGGLIVFGLGLGKMAEAVKDMALKDVGIMLASIAGVGVAVAGVGLLAAPILIGASTLLLIGASLGLLGFTLKSWNSFNPKNSIQNIETAVGGLKEIFGLESKPTESLGDKLKSLAGGPLEMGLTLLNGAKSLMQMGIIAIATGLSNTILVRLLGWSKYNPDKAVSNLTKAITGLKKLYGFDTKKNEKPKDKIRAIKGKLLDMGLSLLQGGGVLAQVGVISIATAMSDVIRLGLMPWNNYDPKPAVDNLSYAITNLTSVFGLDNIDAASNPLGNLFGSMLQMGITLMKAGGAFVKIGVITLSVGMSEHIAEHLKVWEESNLKKSVAHLDTAVSELTRIFGLTGSNIGEITNIKEFSQSILKTGASIFDFAIALLKGGKTFIKLGTIALSTYVLEKIRDNILVWESFNPSQSITHISSVVYGLTELFGLDTSSVEYDVNTGSDWLNDIISLTGSKIVDRFKFGVLLLRGGKSLAKLGMISFSTSILHNIMEDLKTWDAYNPTNAINNISKVLTELPEKIKLKDTENKIITIEDGFFKNLLSKGEGFISRISENIEKFALLAKSGLNVAYVALSTSILSGIADDLMHWENFNGNNAVDNIQSTLTALNSIKFEKNFSINASKVKKGFKDIASGLESFKGLNNSLPILNSINAINAMDMSKINATIDLFKSFAQIDNKPIDRFTQAVNTFADSCNDLISTLNNFDNTIKLETTNTSSQSNEIPSNNSGVNIGNTQDLASAIAEAIRSIPINVESSISDVKLVVNNEAGRRVILTLDN